MPRGAHWAGFSGRPAGRVRLTLAAIESLKAEFSLDPERFYIVGVSMGGGGVWDVVTRFPNICDGGSDLRRGRSGDGPKIMSLPRLVFSRRGGHHGQRGLRAENDRRAAEKRAGSRHGVSRRRPRFRIGTLLRSRSCCRGCLRRSGRIEDDVEARLTAGVFSVGQGTFTRLGRHLARPGSN
jgi:hypothetical protein